MSTTFPDSHLDLLQAPHTGTLSTIGPDGVPQVTALWYLLDDGEIKISLSSARQKFKNLRDRPLATLFVIDPTNTQRTIEVRGSVDLTVDDEYAFADRAVAHYGNLFDVRDVDQPGEQRYVATMRPTRVNTVG